MGTVEKNCGHEKGRVTGKRGPAALIEIAGQKRIIMENHRGISYYGDDRILIRTEYGFTEITGNGLLLRCITRERLCITGVIDAVKLIGRSDG